MTFRGEKIRPPRREESGSRGPGPGGGGWGGERRRRAHRLGPGLALRALLGLLRILGLCLFLRLSWRGLLVPLLALLGRGGRALLRALHDGKGN